MDNLTKYETDLIEHLRKDANEVKDCFTQFSFQVIAVSAVALGLIARFQPTFPLLGLTSICVVLMALSVGRIGTYKYGTANRIHGYELYLERVRRLRDSPGWKKSYREVGWEEAVRAWRTVQPTIFRYYYHWGDNTRNSLKAEHAKLRYPWFEPAKLHALGSVYYAGSYLRTMLSILFMIVALGLTSMAAMVVQLVVGNSLVQAAAVAVAVVVVTVIVIAKIRQLSQRRRLLEGGILCIHSCAIMWQLVVVAHHRALTSLEGYDGYFDRFIRGVYI